VCHLVFFQEIPLLYIFYCLGKLYVFYGCFCFVFIYLFVCLIVHLPFILNTTNFLNISFHINCLEYLTVVYTWMSIIVAFTLHTQIFPINETTLKTLCFKVNLVFYQCSLEDFCQINQTKWRISILTFYPIERNKESLKNLQNDKIENVTGSVWLSLFMDGNGMCKLPSTPLITGLCRIRHLTCTGKILTSHSIYLTTSYLTIFS
jgi:hypothetical protein